MQEIKNHDWQKLDEQYRFQDYNQRLQTAKNLGYDYVFEMIVKQYRKNKSSIKTENTTGFSRSTIQRLLRKIKEPVRSRGGVTSGDDVLKTWNSKTYNPQLYFPGPLCRHNHNWNNTGQSLRRIYTQKKISHNYCIMCRYLSNRNIYLINKHGAERNKINEPQTVLKKAVR